MTIQTAEEKYEVVNKLRAEYGRERYVCIRESDGKKVLLVEINQKKIIYDVVEYMSEVSKNEKFSELIGYFASNGNLYIVFEYRDGKTLKEYLDTINDFTDRVDIVRNLLEYLIIQDMPAYFACNGLETDAVVLNDALEISMVYSLKNIENYSVFGFSQALVKFGKVISEIFKQEIQIQSIDALNQWFDELFFGNYESFMDVYKGFMEVYMTIRTTPESRRRIPKTIGFQRWEKIRSYFKVVKRIVIIVLIVLALVFLVYNVGDSMQHKQTTGRAVDKIGTLEIGTKK